jgi:tripartite-type tricarboxylate transporter receptor subunit TctC
LLGRRSALAGIGTVVAAFASGSDGAAQGGARFPDRPVRLLLPGPAGGAADTQMRLLCDIASRHLGRPVVVENRPGAAGTLGALAMKSARPDGHTLAAVTVTVFRQPLLSARPAFDPRADFTWVIQLAGLVIGLVVRADAPWRSLREFLDHARANPGQVSYGIPGVNTTEMPLEVIARAEGIEWLPVPFRSGPEGLQALLAGQIDAVADTGTWVPFVEEGQLRLLATFGTVRSRRFPEVATLREHGSDVATENAFGIVGPRGLEAGVTRTLHDAFRAALFDSAHLAALERYHMPVLYLGSEDYTREALRLYEQERIMLERLGRLPAPG